MEREESTVAVIKGLLIKPPDRMKNRCDQSRHQRRNGNNIPKQNRDMDVHTFSFYDFSIGYSASTQPLIPALSSSSYPQLSKVSTFLPTYQTIPPPQPPNVPITPKNQLAPLNPRLFTKKKLCPNQAHSNSPPKKTLSQPWEKAI